MEMKLKLFFPFAIACQFVYSQKMFEFNSKSDSLCTVPNYYQTFISKDKVYGFSSLPKNILFIDLAAISRTMIYGGFERKVIKNWYVAPFIGFSFKADIMALKLNNDYNSKNKNQSELNYAINSNNASFTPKYVFFTDKVNFDPYKSFGLVYGLESRFYFKSFYHYALAINFGFRSHDSQIYMEQKFPGRKLVDNSVFDLVSENRFTYNQSQFYSGIYSKFFITNHLMFDAAFNLGHKKIVYKIKLKSFAKNYNPDEYLFFFNPDKNIIFFPSDDGAYPKQTTVFLMFNFRLAYSF